MKIPPNISIGAGAAPLNIGGRGLLDGDICKRGLSKGIGLSELFHDTDIAWLCESSCSDISAKMQSVPYKKRTLARQDLERLTLHYTQANSEKINEHFGRLRSQKKERQDTNAAGSSDHVGCTASRAGARTLTHRTQAHTNKWLLQVFQTQRPHWGPHMASLTASKQSTAGFTTFWLPLPGCIEGELRSNRDQ